MEKVFDYLCKEAENSGDSDFEVETCCANCCDMCCSWNCSCNLDDYKHLLRTKQLISKKLRCIKTKGLKLIHLAIFPLFQDIFRDLFVIAELIFVLVMLALSVAIYRLSTDTQGFDLARMIFVAVSSFLAIVDSVYTLRQCKTCKRCCGKADLRECGDKEESRCYKCCSCFKNTFDLVRMLVTEAVIYPLLICNIIDVVTGRGYLGNTPREIACFALFVFSCMFLVLYVYIARLSVLIGIIKTLTRMRQNSNSSAFRYLLCLLLHACLQMLLQILMLISIGGKIRYGNRHFYEPDNVDNSIHVSPQLIYMMCAGYFVPFFGFYTFFIVTYYWSQEFPIRLYLDMVKLFHMKACGREEITDIGKSIRSKQHLIAKMVDSDAEDEYYDLSRVNWIIKFLFPFKSPLLIVVCCCYCCALLAFGNIVILGGGGWIVFDIVTCCILVLSNLYVLVVAIVWICVISVLLALVALVLFCLAGTAVGSILLLFWFVGGGACYLYRVFCD